MVQFSSRFLWSCQASCSATSNVLWHKSIITFLSIDRHSGQTDILVASAHVTHTSMCIVFVDGTWLLNNLRSSPFVSATSPYGLVLQSKHFRQNVRNYCHDICTHWYSKKDLNVCDDGILMQLLTSWTSPNVLSFYLMTTFQRLDCVSSLTQKPIRLGPSIEIVSVSGNVFK
jgi:hypothetical protein